MDTYLLSKTFDDLAFLANDTSNFLQ
jgi:hypothetical protein